jgi:hypothetical protein
MCRTGKLSHPVLLVLGVAGVCFLGAPALAKAPREPKPAEPIPFADGVIDPDLRTAYVSSPKGGIQAVRLEDGKVLWTNDDCPGQPWVVAGRRLVARGERLFVLDLKEGKLLRECDAPAYPRVAVPERCTVSFQLWGPHVAGDTLEAQWYGVANIDRSKGRPFPFEAWTAFNKAAPVGTVKVSLDTGKVALQSDPKPADVTAGLVPGAAKPEQRVPAELPAKLAPMWQQYHKDQNARITVLGDRLVGVSMTLEPMGADFLKKFVLNAWDLKTGEAAAPVELVRDKAINIANVVLTEDRRHAAVVFGTSALAVYSLTDGKPVGAQVKGVHSPEKAFVEGKRLYYSRLGERGAAQTPSFLHALDLDSGKEAWQLPLKPRSTIPLPP